MKVKHEAMRRDGCSPFALTVPKFYISAGKEPKKKNSTLSLHDVDEGRSMEYLLTRFQDEIKSSSNEIVLRKQNLLAAISEYVFWKEFHCLLPSFLVC